MAKETIHKLFGSGGMRHMCWMLLSVLLFAAKLAPVHADIDPGSDFGGWMDAMASIEEEERRYEEKLREHEVWKQNTWSGLAVRKIQGMAYHFKPFFLAVQDALRETSGNDSSTTHVLMYVVVRIVVVVVMMILCYIGAKVLQLLVGGDYEVVEEIVVVHEHETEEEAAKARAKTTRGKKTKSS
ncbi:unnamed protein product [Pseudo-nitzschia multistriata]|uniref:Uncharacterized protein n=1 Tax=Pseudo-nitzschia multistriata TaxID=183589 RepID=A0A448YYZ6_9STRA|nr:unnamed protein product [Pseudo-nitzschia multistriata]